jgi:hypothetical protein
MVLDQKGCCTAEEKDESWMRRLDEERKRVPTLRCHHKSNIPSTRSLVQTRTRMAAGRRRLIEAED